MSFSSSANRLRKASRRRRKLHELFAGLITLALGCGAGAAATTPTLPLHTSGANIVDSNGNTVRLNAVNWYGTESTDYVVAGLQAASLQSIVNEIKGLGFNAVRLPWSNQMYESNPQVQDYALAANPGMEGENALTILDQVVNELTSAGIMVILDNHNSNAEWCCSTSDGNSLWYNSQYPQSNWIADWQGIVKRYQGNPLVIGADLRNEPRGTATWGGSSSTDWHAAAELGANAVLSVNPNLLIFVEGVSYASDLSGVSSLPILLNVPNQVVYEAHNYGSSQSGYSSFISAITPKWGYLVTGIHPQPFWIGEFGTCNTANKCVISSSSSDKGYWFNMLTAYMQEYGVNWSYWPINGTHSTGGNSTYGATETFGVLNASWNGSSLGALTSRLGSMMTSAATPSIAIIPSGSPVSIASGGSGASTVTIVPENGFTGTVNLSCAVSGPGGAVNLPTCVLPSSESISGDSAVDVAVSINTTGSVASGFSQGGRGSSFLDRRGGIVLACALLLIGNLARRRGAVLPVLIATIVVLLPSACGGGGNGTASAVTTPGSYTITVTGAPPSVSPATAQIFVEVQ